MLYIEGNTIRLTRGDTAYLTVPIRLATDEEYIMDKGDTLILSVKKSLRDETYAFQKRVEGENTIHIEPIDTEHMEFGKYKYDLQLNTSGGDVFTLIEVDTFELLPEVTRT